MVSRSLSNKRTRMNTFVLLSMDLGVENEEREGERERNIKWEKNVDKP